MIINVYLNGCSRLHSWDLLTWVELGTSDPCEPALSSNDHLRISFWIALDCIWVKDMDKKSILKPILSTAGRGSRGGGHNHLLLLRFFSSKFYDSKCTRSLSICWSVQIEFMFFLGLARACKFLFMSKIAPHRQFNSILNPHSTSRVSPMLTSYKGPSLCLECH